MTVKGIHQWTNSKDSAKSDPSQNSLSQASYADNSVILNMQKLKHSTKKDTAINKYIKRTLLCDILRLVLAIVLLVSLVVLIRQTKYTLINIQQIKTVAGFNADDKSYTLMENTEELIEKDKYRYNILIVDEIFESIADKQCVNIPDESKFDCHPEDGASELSCMNRGCCWNALGKEGKHTARFPLNTPFCYYPKNWSLYKCENFTKKGNEFLGFFTQTVKSPYKQDVPLIKEEIISISGNIFRVKISDPLNKRYEPPWPIRNDHKPFVRTISNAQYKVHTDGIKPGFQLMREEDGVILFDSLYTGGFIFADQFLQMSTLLSSHNIYGLGEHRSALKLNTTWNLITLFNKDEVPTENANLYGSHPFYLVMENSGKAHGVLFLNSNAMDIILQPAPAITFRTIGGIFDFYFFLGPTPADVIRQYSEIVGKPFLPPYWSLGFHLCRFGYGSLENTEKVWNRTRAAEIPFDTQWNDLDYMDKNNDFTYDSHKFKNLPQFVNRIHSVGMHYIPLIDAGISASERNGTYLPYDEGVKQNIFVKDAVTNKPFIGKVWNYISTVWPDFTNPNTKDYYHNMMNSLHKSIEFDGAWIDMNEPSNFYNGLKNGCPHNDLDYSAYVPNVVGGLLATKTLCMNAKHYAGPHYNLHSTYGTSQAIATNYALTKIRQKRPFIISRSTWVGHGFYAGHWSGDVYSSWHSLRMSIPEILSFNFYQIPMMGADICGFDGNTTVPLCNRWMQLGAFYPFSRNHNSDDTIEQDPVAMGDLVVKSSKRALSIRYWLLPYLYTLFFRAHKFGDTVVRPLFFEFSDDPSTYDIDTQFLWGNSLLINPVLEDNKTTVDAYLPRGLWYDFYTLKSTLAAGKSYTLDAPLDTIPLMIRGGSILPTQKPGVTTTESRRNSFSLVVALNDKGTAEGELYWDDGDSLDSYQTKQYLWVNFTVKNEILSSEEIEYTTFDPQINLDRIQVLGVTSKVYKVVLNGKPVRFEYDADRSHLRITGLNFPLRKQFKLFWDYSQPKLHNI